MNVAWRSKSSATATLAMRSRLALDVGDAVDCDLVRCSKGIER